MEIGDQIEVEVSSIAHGGHCVARHDGQVIFVRHAIPSERVIVEITSKSKNFARGECVKVLIPSPNRVTPPCKYAHPAGCGGCDFQHISLTHQRTLKARIIKEQFQRLAKKEIDVTVEEVTPTLHWRSRMEFTVNANRKLSLFAARSNELVEIDECLIADEAMILESINQRKLPVGKKVDIVVSSGGDSEVVIEGRENHSLIKEVSSGYEFTLNPISFWQSHKSAPALLTSVVREFAEAKTGEHVFDLYGGAGLFTASIMPDVGIGGRVTLIESDDNAITDAKRNFAVQANVEIVQSRVDSALKKYVSGDVVILDPPRAGAGNGVISAVVGLKPRTIVYVACDPAALARDTGYLEALGYRLDKLRAFDLFPMTAHMECVARFMPTAG